MTKEIWKDIAGYGGLYEISNYGNVKSMGRVVRDSIGRVRNIKPKQLKPSITAKMHDKDTGYLEVRLTNKRGKSKNFLVHRLVAEAFIENNDNKQTVNHIDGNKLNNEVSNLEWATFGENNTHAIDNHLRRDNRYVARTDSFNRIIGIYPSMHEADRQTGVDYRRIHRLCNSYDNFDGEFYWDYIENFEVSNSALYFAKVKPDAIIPSQEIGSAGYDFYAHIEGIESEHEGVVREQLLEKNKVNFVGTGVASAMSDEFCLNFKNERSSFAKNGATVLAGLIDSNYRGEIKLMVLPLMKDILITDQVEETEEYEDIILIPMNKAIAQATLQYVPIVEVKEIPYSGLSNIPSFRGTGGWGSSGK